MRVLLGMCEPMGVRRRSADKMGAGQKLIQFSVKVRNIVKKEKKRKERRKKRKEKKRKEEKRKEKKRKEREIYAWEHVLKFFS